MGDIGNPSQGSTTTSGPAQPPTTLPVGAGAPPAPTSTGILVEGRQLAEQGVPMQVQGLLNAITELRGRAQGSVADILPDILDQIATLRGQYASASQALGRRLGPYGGGQTQRDQANLLAQATGQYGTLLASQQRAGFANLINTLGGFTPALSGGARAPQVGTTTSPFNTAGIGQGLYGIGRTAQQLYQYYNTPTATDIATTTGQLRLGGAGETTPTTIYPTTEEAQPVQIATGAG